MGQKCQKVPSTPKNVRKMLFYFLLWVFEGTFDDSPIKDECLYILFWTSGGELLGDVQQYCLRVRPSSTAAEATIHFPARQIFAALYRSFGRCRNLFSKRFLPGSKGGTLGYCAASTMVANASALREAPPMRPPSMFSIASSSAALAAFMEPPYWITVERETTLP